MFYYGNLNDVVGQYTSVANNLIEKETRLEATKDRGRREGWLDEGGRRVQTSSCKITKY